MQRLTPSGAVAGCGLYRNDGEPGGQSVESSSSASALMGILKARSSSATQLGSASGSSSAYFQENLTIQSPGLEGSQGVFSAGMQLAYLSRLTTNTGDGRWFDNGTSINLSLVIGTSTGTRSYSLRQSALERVETWSAVDNGITVDFAGPISLTVPFVVGDAIQISGSISVSSTAEGDDEYASLQAYQSAYWTGITGLAVEGAHVPYTLSPDSGIDWSRSMVPVPEPAPIWLFSVFLVLFPFWRGIDSALTGSAGFSVRCRPHGTNLHCSAL